MRPRDEFRRGAERDYEAPRSALLALAYDLIVGRRRSFADTGQVMLDANPLPRRIDGVEHIPRAGAFVVVMNHNSRRGLRPYHCALVVSATVAHVRADGTEICWAFASEMYGQHIGPLPIPLWLVRWVFRRIALVYDLVVVPRREELVSARAVALRRLRRALEHRPVGLTPEGVGQFALVEPPDGTGLLLQMLTRRGAPLLPVAAWEQEDSTLVVRFGPAFQISVAAGPPRHERDNRIRTQAMVAIGRLMPSSRWGAYAEAIAESVRASGADEAT